ncbi:MAG: tetratricopeptide repeat protein [Acidobacteriota bacterium]
MPIDRNDALRRAEKLLRQGRLDAAIAEYTKVADEYPRDLTTGNLLGDLHVRAGQIDRAVAQYTRMAEHLARDGFVSRAAALYKKILKIQPDDDTALQRSADLAGQQGLGAEARACLQALYQARVARGDRDGAAEAAIRRASADPSDVTGHFDAAHLLTELGRVSEAAGQLREAGLELLRQGRQSEGDRALSEALRFDATDAASRDRLIDLRLQTGHLDEAADLARTADQVGRVVRTMSAAGQHEAAVERLTGALSSAPDDPGLRLELARLELRRGRAGSAWSALPRFSDSETADTTLLRAEILARAGSAGEARGLIERLTVRDATAAAGAAQLCWSLAEADSAAALVCIGPVIDAARRSHDPWEAKAILQRLAGQSREPIGALRLLIDVCGDLADEDGVYHGQVRLADELLAAGRYAEARTLAQHLVEKRPDIAQHAERLRAANDGLVLRPGPNRPDARPEAGAATLDLDLGTPAAGRLPAVPQARVSREPGAAGSEGPEVFRLDPVDADVRDALGLLDVAPVSGEGPASVEVDLSRALDGLMMEQPPADSAVRPEAPPAAEPPDLDGFFRMLREQSGADDRTASALQSVDLAYRAYSAGRLDECRHHLQQAARDPRCRFRAAALLARIERDRGRLHDAIEWLERAAESSAPSPGAWDVLLYDLGDTLEEAGERRRALAVFMELHSASPGYRDVDRRIGRLKTSDQALGRHAPDRETG